MLSFITKYQTKYLDSPMLNYLDFSGLTHSQQAEAVWKGAFLGERTEAGQTVQLYRLDTFYVEAFYDPVNNRVNRFSAFNNSASLAPYIDLAP